ncbi:MAG: tRNA pseudouridine(38-40) synthase TruA, partial [Gemmatimonadales bacterium]
MAPVPAKPAVRYRATVEYDGAAFSGYQVQPSVRTVQGTIESQLERMLNGQVRVHAAGRTDAGVHAVGQEIVFDALPPWNAADLSRALNSLLPDDILVRNLRPSGPAFHPRFDATGRRYEYYVGPPSTGPLRAARVWALAEVPDFGRLKNASALLIGRRSFAALSKAGQPELGTECTVELASWTRTCLGDLRFTIVADRFLHRMVRYVVGTLVEVGIGRRDVAEWSDLLCEQEARPPEPAPACALYLTGVRYAEGWNRNPGVPCLWPMPDGDHSDRPNHEV